MLIYSSVWNIANILCLFCLFVSPFVSKKRQKSWTTIGPEFCLARQPHYPSEGLWMLRITKSSIQKILNFLKFSKLKVKIEDAP